MTDEMKTTLREDFLSWSGGFPPDSDDQITVYLDYACRITGHESDVREFLREWSNSSDDEP